MEVSSKVVTTFACLTLRMCTCGTTLSLIWMDPTREVSTSEEQMFLKTTQHRLHRLTYSLKMVGLKQYRHSQKESVSLFRTITQSHGTLLGRSLRRFWVLYNFGSEVKKLGDRVNITTATFLSKDWLKTNTEWNLPVNLEKKYYLTQNSRRYSSHMLKLSDWPNSKTSPNGGNLWSKSKSSSPIG